MKRFISIIFISAIVFQSTSTLWILGSFYINRDYISKNICVNRFESIPVCKGQCYLKQELKENEQQQKKLPDLKQKEVQLYCQEKNIQENLIMLKEVTLLKIDYISNFHVSNFSNSIFHPPQLV